MKIIDKNNTRFLIKDDNSEINISDGQYIKYTGIYYKNNFNSENIEKNMNLSEQSLDKEVFPFIDIPENIETTFYGIVECCRYRHDLGTTGIYIEPLYILLNNKFFKIINYTKPTTKYFLYPHLLMLPDTYYHYKSLYFLDTVENIMNLSLDKELFSGTNVKENITYISI